MRRTSRRFVGWRGTRIRIASRWKRAAGLPQSTIARLERGTRNGTVEQMRKLAGALGINLDTLCG